VAVRALSQRIARPRSASTGATTRDPTLPTVLLENFAALLSLVTAAAGIALTPGDRGGFLGCRGV
jgi:hypothetical protein